MPVVGRYVPFTETPINASADVSVDSNLDYGKPPAAPSFWSPQPGSLPLGADGGWRLLSLDVLRGLAILLVLFGHVQFRMPENALAGRFWDMLRQAAVVGVGMFLVLSGFLVGGMLLTEQQDKGRISLGRFFVRRAWRLWPSYFLAILFGWQWYHRIRIVGPGGTIVKGATLPQMWPFFAHVQNYYNVADKNFGAGAVMQTWTIAALVQFYIVAALLLAGLSLIGRRAIHALPLIIAALFVACFLMRWSVAPVDANAYDAWRNYFPTHLRLDEPMFGVLLAYLVVHCRAGLEKFMRKGWPLVALVGVTMTLPTALRKEEGPRFLCIWGYTLSGVGCGLILLCAWWYEQARVRKLAAGPQKITIVGYLARGVAWIGVWSYSIYLWHQPLIEHVGNLSRNFIGNHLVKWNNPLHYPVAVAAFVVMAIAFGVIMYYVVEFPFSLLRDKLTRSDPRAYVSGDGMPASRSGGASMNRGGAWALRSVRAQAPDPEPVLSR